jgi:predicted nucleic acid-binding protein
MDILLDTVLLITPPDPQLLSNFKDSRFFVSSISYAELAEGEFSINPIVQVRAPLDLARAQQLYGKGLPFDDAAANLYRMVCKAVVAHGRQVTRVRRIDMMIAAIAVANNCALATRNIADYAGLEQLTPLLPL